MPRHKFLSPEVLDEAVEEIVELAERDGAEVALVGGRAMQLYGSDRLTGDIDFLAREPFGGLKDDGPLSFGGFKTHADNGVPVDIIIRNDDYADLYNEALEQAAEIEDVPDIPIVAPEYLAAMKMASARGKDSVDFDWLVTSCDDFDFALARKIIKKHLGVYAAQEFDQAVEEAKWKASRGR